MCAKSVDELFVYQKALAAADAVSAILKRESFKRDLRFREDLGASSQSVAALVAEGFSQNTDRHFASYLFRSRGSSSETRTHLHAARVRAHITLDEEVALAMRYNEIEKMLTGLIAHLQREDRRTRG